MGRRRMGVQLWEDMTESGCRRDSPRSLVLR